MKNILTTTSVVLCLVSMNAAAAFRADVISDRDLAVEGETWAFQFSSGVIDGEAKEYVFIYDAELGGGRYKLSQLDWDIKRVVMAGGNVTLRDGRGTINIGYWKAVTKGDDGHIEDYDWFNPESKQWTEYSDSYADVVDASIFDINAGWEFLHDVYGFNARVLLGYKMDSWKWRAYDGYGLYSDLNYEPYYFGDGTSLKYEQKIAMPYVGSSVDWVYGGFVFSAYCSYSPFVRMDCKDNHVLRSLNIKDTFKDGDMLAAGASARYGWESGWFLAAALDFQKINLIVGDARYQQYYPDYDVLYTESFDNYAGASNEYLSLSLGVGKTF